jgi:FkbM family methyltransferase
MAFPKSLIRRAKDAARPALLGVRRDSVTGHLYYRVAGYRLHLRFPEEAIRERDRRRTFEEVYFRHYRPRGSDCVVDIGAGIGTEILPLAREAPGLRYVAVEIQPWVYECLALTLAQLPEGFTPFGLAIGGSSEVRITPTRDGQDVSTLGGGGAVPVAGIGWSDFAARHGIGRVALLKMNVEGAEADLLEHIDLGQVDRVVVGVHDFRADRGEGEHFRTRARVEARLAGAGFGMRPVGTDWIYAER